MSEECTSNCSACGKDCAERKPGHNDLLERPHELSRIKKVIGVVSGKGGVGKSMVTAMLAVLARHPDLAGRYLEYMTALALQNNSKWVIGSGGGTPILDLREAPVASPTPPPTPAAPGTD